MTRPADRRHAIELIRQAKQSGASLEKACQELSLSLRTYQRWIRGGEVVVDGRPDAARPAPANKLSPDERERLLSVCNTPRYQSLPPSQIVPLLADEGVYLASESTFYRVLRSADQLHRRGKARAPRSVTKPPGFRATAANQVWSWDITFLANSIVGCFYRLYLVMDIYSRKIVGWEVHESESAEHAAQLIRKACLAEGITEKGLVLHSDNGSPMKGATMLATLQRLGVVPSFSRPSVSNDNPYSESLFGTMKYTPAFPSQPFDSLEAAREWVHRFVHWYNEMHRHSGIRFVTPAQRHRGEDRAILEQRTAVYTQAKQNTPERWSGDIRDWTPPGEVWLNPENPTTDQAEIREVAA
jgi:transposase InsO family protein